MSLIWCLAVLKTIHLCHLFRYICLFSGRCHGMCVEVRKLTCFFPSCGVPRIKLKSPGVFLPRELAAGPKPNFFLMHLCGCFVCTMLCLVPSETQKGLQIPWSCSYRQLWTTMWVLRNQPGFSWKTLLLASVWAISLIFFCLVAVLSNPEHFVPG